MSKVCAALIIILLLSIPVVFPVLLTILIIRAVRKKPIKKWVISLVVYTVSIIPLTIFLTFLGAFTDPATWCDHQYEILEDIAPTCTEKGKLTKYCPLCEKKTYDYPDTIPHSWKMDSAVSATCTTEGHTVEKCERCMTTRKTNITDALGHAMKEVSRREPTQTSDGEVVSRCERCGHDETVVLPKLPVSEDSVTEEVGASSWKTVFRASGFTESEISKYEEMLTNVGITDYHDVEVIENGVMHIVRGKIFDSDILQVNVTLENREIIVIRLAGIPAEKTEAYINWRGNIKFKKVETKKSVDLYYDVEGGYIAKLDWANKMISPYEE